MDSCLIHTGGQERAELHIAILYKYGHFDYYKIPVTESFDCVDSFEPTMSFELAPRSSKENNIHFTCMKVHWRTSCIQDSILATCDSNTPLSLWTWKGDKLACVFSAKLPSEHQHFSAKQLTLANDIEFITSTHSDSYNLPIVALGTQGRQIYIYDPRCGGKPVLSKSCESIIKHLHYIPKARFLLFSDTKGNLEALDERSSLKSLGKYRDFVGAITQISHYDNPINMSQQLVVTTSLDRFVRLHDVQKRTLVIKVYMTQNLSCLSLYQRISHCDDDVEEMRDDDVDNIWTNIPTVDNCSKTNEI